jgi:hypothetical protein
LLARNHALTLLRRTVRHQSLNSLLHHGTIAYPAKA